MANCLIVTENVTNVVSIVLLYLTFALEKIYNVMIMFIKKTLLSFKQKMWWPGISVASLNMLKAGFTICIC